MGLKGITVPTARVPYMGGGNSCPWKEKSSAEAKKGAAAFMLRMSDGVATSGTP